MSQPQERFKLGLEQIAIFQNEGQNGKYLNAQVEGRRYKDDESGDWHNSHSYSASQLANHIAICQAALNYMINEAPSD